MRLKILQALSHEFPANLLEDTYLIACQHILPSTYYMLLSLLDLGIPSENMAVIGKCYSTSNLATKMILEEKIHVASESSFFDGYQSFDSSFKEKLKAFFIETIQKWDLSPTSRLVILDDGGELIKIANDYLSSTQTVFAVEQTTSGYDKLKDELLKFPIINVARSDAKLIFESPMIAEAQVNRITETLPKFNFMAKKLLIMGNGFIGSALARKLSSSYNVTCYDKILTLTDIQTHELRLHNYDLIIGTTGKTVLPFNFHHQLQNPVTLISASSSDREFDAVYFRRQREKISNCHEDIMVNGVFLPNCGFPINFRGSEEDSVPLSKIQLTIALLFAGICQSVYEKPIIKNFVPLNKRLQDLIVKNFHAIDSEKIFF
ncbi:hypothetical protein [Candidatus Odyssella acanthamoebae]|uniref:S-adenosyl-L-homocysteine hydrolase NAD binding domain-containing protein n=1 Tax=Candidatus Odyssella acanthamoebae TaxID=91604 RepID=A0A077AV40_9PROT|nr:hypothetical protein [Candidatus Paracaedibacter acanthamoebae]AIK96276.1 hypothetical protein ID47_05265 [Candidatus Paracaedibacter acanthamoebae]